MPLHPDGYAFLPGFAEYFTQAREVTCLPVLRDHDEPTW
jgi:hypothetical protein